MKISLRKANALQLVVVEQLNEKIVGEVTVGKFDNATEIISEATNTLTNNIVKKFDLLETMFSIRKKVSAKNAEVGIDALLTDLAENERHAAFLKQLASTKIFAPKKDVLDRALEDLRKDVLPVNGYVREKTVIQVSLFDKITVESYAKSLTTLRKQKQGISDKLLHLNVSSEIELDEKERGVLLKYDIL